MYMMNETMLHGPVPLLIGVALFNLFTLLWLPFYVFIHLSLCLSVN